MDHLKYFKALSDETRIRLLNILLRHELKVGELVAVLGMGQSRISRHLKILAAAGLVENLREGVWGFYYIARSGPGRRFIDAVRYLFEADPAYEDDIREADRIIEERRLSTLRFFDHIAPRWDLFKGEILGDFDLNRAIFKNTGTHRVGVDLGCGTGDLLEPMNRHAEKVIGVDSSPRMLEEARKQFQNAGGNFEIRLGEIEHLPLSDGEADFVVISLVLQYMAKPAAAIAEVSRILKPGGLFVIADFGKHENSELFEKYGARWLGFSRREVEDWLTPNGFELQTVDSYPLEKALSLHIYHAIKNVNK
ncbi:MAG: ArsR family transcriptional regulator [Desulfobacterales bacterium]|nr:ArsR family transcriptional regulator [Desulfobacterales bacterium]